MDKAIIFIKLNKFYSKAKDKEYYTIEYIDEEDKKYYLEFITAEQYDNLYKKNLEFMEYYKAIYTIGNNRKIVIKDIE